MATAGSARQGRWRSKGWMHLIFQAIKNYGQLPTSPATTQSTLDTWYTGSVGPSWRRPRDQNAKYKGTQLALRCTTQVTAEIIHGIACCFAHIRLIQKPLREKTERQQCAQHKKTAARKKIATYLLKLHRQQLQQEAVQARLTHRQGKVSANTRTIQATQRINYAEIRFRNKPSIRKDELYQMLRAWPRRDKIGPVLAQHHPHHAST